MTVRWLRGWFVRSCATSGLAVETDRGVDVRVDRSTDQTPTQRSGAAGRVVRLVDGLRLGRAALPQEHGQKDQGADRQELALPVLEGLEPEVGGEHEAQRGDGLPTLRDVLAVVLLGTAQDVGNQRRHEECDEGDRQGVRIELPGDASDAGGPRGTWPCRVGLPVDGLGGVGILRFG